MLIEVVSKRVSGDGGPIPYRRTGTAGANIPANPYVDGLVAWYSAGAEYVTKDLSDYVSQWNDKSGLGHHFVQATGASQPLWVASAKNGLPGIRFDGSNDCMVAAFALHQPRTEYWVIKQITFAEGDPVTGGGGIITAGFGQQGGTPNLIFGAEVSLAGNGNLAIDTWGVLCGVLNGASSVSRVNNTADVTGNSGSNQPEGISLGGWTTVCSNIEVCEGLVYSVAHNATYRSNMMAWLKSMYATP